MCQPERHWFIRFQLLYVIVFATSLVPLINITFHGIFSQGRTLTQRKKMKRSGQKMWMKLLPHMTHSLAKSRKQSKPQRALWISVNEWYSCLQEQVSAMWFDLKPKYNCGKYVRIYKQICNPNRQPMAHWWCVSLLCRSLWVRIPAGPILRVLNNLRRKSHLQMVRLSRLLGQRC